MPTTLFGPISINFVLILTKLKPLNLDTSGSRFRLFSIPNKNSTSQMCQQGFSSMHRNTLVLVSKLCQSTGIQLISILNKIWWWWSVCLISTSQRIKCLAQRHNAVPCEARPSPAAYSSFEQERTPPLWATCFEPLPFSWWLVPSFNLMHWKLKEWITAIQTMLLGSSIIWINSVEKKLVGVISLDRETIDERCTLSTRIFIGDFETTAFNLSNSFMDLLDKIS